MSSTHSVGPRAFGPRLSSGHYASGWRIPQEGELNDLKTVNQMGITYAQSPDGPVKEALCLQLLENFHGYISKYLNMIVRGHLPSQYTPAGRDARKMLMTLIARGKPINQMTLLGTCRTLHLAFKQNTSDDIYDILVTCLMRAIRRYDPNYTLKVKAVCQAIDRSFRRRKQFSAQEVSDAVGFDGLGCLRLLVRKEVLASIAGPKKKVVGYTKTANWPLPDSFFASGPIGFTYVLQTWFRYYLHEYISGAMSELESKEGVLQLEHRFDHAEDPDSGGEAIPHAEGNFTDRDGHTWAADVSLLNLPLDVSLMTSAWVRGTKDKLFRKLTIKERHLLYLVYVKELKWVEIAASLDCDTATIRKQFDQVLTYLKARVRYTNQPQ